MQVGNDNDRYQRTIRVRLPGNDLRRLSRLSPARSIAQIAAEWLLIGSAIGLVRYTGSWWSWPVAVIVVGARQHALGVLMHDAAHFRIVANRRINDLISDLLLAWPLFVTTEGYRRVHFPHHRHVNTAEDPDWASKQTPEWAFPKSRRALYSLLAADLLGLRIPQQFREVVRPLNTADTRWASRRLGIAARSIYYLALITPAVWFPGYRTALLLWMLAWGTWLKFVLRIRSIAEHFAIDRPGPVDYTRTTVPSWLERLLVAPNHVCYHIEHHLYPGVPFFRLPELHRRLRQDPTYSRQACIEHGYLSVLRNCLSTPRPRR